MNAVMCQLKLLEALVGIVSIALLCFGSFKVVPLTFESAFRCLIIYVNTMLAINGVVNICNHQLNNANFELVLNICGCVCYFYVSMHIMYDVQNNHYASLLSDFTDPIPPTALYAKWLSISCLACGFLYLIHTTFLIDYIFIGRETVFLSGVATPLKLPLQLYVCGKNLHTRLERFDWFKEFEEIRLATEII